MMSLRALRALVRPAFAVLLILPALAACSSRVAPPEPPISVRRGDLAFSREDYETAIGEYRFYLDDEDQGIHTPRTFYKCALAYYRLGQYSQALDTLDELDRRYPNAHWVQTEALRGDCQRELGRPIPAIAAWDSAWTVATDTDKPKLRARINGVLAQLDVAQLDETEQLVQNQDVKLMVDKTLADRNGGRPAAPVMVAGRNLNDANLQPSNTLVGSLQRLDTDEPSNTLVGSIQRTGTEEAPPPAPAAPYDAAAAAPEAELAPETEVVEIPAARPVAAAQAPSGLTEETRIETSEPAAKAAPVAAAPVAAPRVVANVPPPSPPAPVAQGRPAAIDQMAKLDPGQDFSTELTPPPARPAAMAPVAAVPVAAAPVAIEPEQDLAEEGSQIGCVVPLTGKDRAIGEHVLRGLRLVFGDSSDRLVIRDSGSNPAMSARLLHQLAKDDTIVAVIGAGSSQEGQALAEAANQDHLPLLLLSDESASAGNFVLPVRTDAGQSKTEVMRTLLENVMGRHGLKQFGVLAPDSREGSELAKLFTAEVGRRGGKVVASDRYAATNPPAVDSVIGQSQEGAQAVFIADDVATVAALTRVAQPQAPQLWLLTVNDWNGTSFSGVVFAPGAASARSASFLERYQSAYGAAPETRDAQAYDAGVVAKALLRSGASSRSAVLTGLDSLGVLEGAVSELKVSRKGIRRQVLQLPSEVSQAQPVPAGHS